MNSFLHLLFQEFFILKKKMHLLHDLNPDLFSMNF